MALSIYAIIEVTSERNNGRTTSTTELFGSREETLARIDDIKKGLEKSPDWKDTGAALRYSGEILFINKDGVAYLVRMVHMQGARSETAEIDWRYIEKYNRDWFNPVEQTTLGDIMREQSIARLWERVADLEKTEWEITQQKSGEKTTAIIVQHDASFHSPHEVKRFKSKRPGFAEGKALKWIENERARNQRNIDAIKAEIASEQV